MLNLGSLASKRLVTKLLKVAYRFLSPLGTTKDEELDDIPCWSTPLDNLLGPCTPKLPEPLFVDIFKREARPGTDSPPPEPILLPMLPLPTMLPTEPVTRGPPFPNTGETPRPGTALRLPIAAEVGRIPGIEPPTPFVLPLYPGLPTTFIAPLFVTPGYPPCELPCDIYK